MRKALLLGLIAVALAGCLRAPEGAAESVPAQSELQRFGSVVQGLLLEAAPSYSGGAPAASLRSASHADLVLFIDRNCSACSAALAQAQSIAQHRRVLVAPIDLSQTTGADFESQLWASNGAAFLGGGGSEVPLWVGTDGCGQDVRLSGVLLPQDLGRLSSCR